MKLQEITSYNLKSATILNEGWQDLTESQRVYVGRWEKELWPLLEEYTRIAEATLTADQIGAIFKGAEAQANASGDNRNALGKAGAAAGAVAKLPVDIAKKVDAVIGAFRNFELNQMDIVNHPGKAFYPEEHGVPSYEELIYISNVKNKDLMFYASVERKKEKLIQLTSSGRLPISAHNIRVIPLDEGGNKIDLINEYSQDADLTVIGFQESKGNIPMNIKLFEGYDKIGNVLFVNTLTSKFIK